MPMALASVGAALLLSTATADAQHVRYSAHPRASLAWWQVDPHFGHLWATTCPEDPSWQPGEGRSPQYYIDYLRRPEIKESGGKDRRIPLYPRKRIRHVCKPAIAAVVELRERIVTQRLQALRLHRREDDTEAIGTNAFEVRLGCLAKVMRGCAVCGRRVGCHCRD